MIFTGLFPLNKCSAIETACPFVMTVPVQRQSPRVKVQLTLDLMHGFI